MSKHCYLFDVDGTLLDCGHRLHYLQQKPKDWDKFFEASQYDTPIEHMCQLARRLGDVEHIVYVSGRPERTRAVTKDMLRFHIGVPWPLYMRKDGDHRDDDIVKSELLDTIISDGYNPIMAFDDRSRVVAMFRNRGVPCCQCAPGDF